jgi:hypothetical protein
MKHISEAHCAGKWKFWMLCISLITIYKARALRMEIGVCGYLSGLCPSFATPKRAQCSGNWVS